MPIEGDLKDISLIGVMQLACMERRKAGLFVSRRGEEGAIYFDTGEIVHATVGHLSGEEAVYQLLTWTDGRFRMSEQVSIPPKSIGKNWNYILIEGMKRIDEQAREHNSSRQSARATTPADKQRDFDLENELMLLLSNLEQLMARLNEAKAQKQAFLALHCLGGMLNQAVALIEGLKGGAATAPNLAKVLHDAGEVYPPVRFLNVQGNRLSVERLSSDNGKAGMVADSRSSLRQICQGLILVLEYYFAFFEHFFHSSEVRDQWRETYSVFIVDLKRTVARVQF
jgi:hypothetical protein